MAQWPFHGEKNGQFETPSLIHDGWDIETLSLIFNCPGPGTWTHLTYVDWKRRCASGRVPEKAAEFLPVPAIWVGLKMFWPLIQQLQWKATAGAFVFLTAMFEQKVTDVPRFKIIHDNFVDKTHGWNGHGSKQNPQIGRTYIYSGSENGFSQ